ncbi:EAL domain-containing protein [Paenibacillus mucilaginosus]|uniref:Probable signaling protein YkoW n=1 Tax=Paenibacillus mucilaginosus (strain KNP414) TaxID=1036673 RepID=F8F8E6_PAEMK|nr:EAL domain-containing protein [Paenibacillus mucilaginosus]AEI41293.1 probable signaling protein YkoW [Paenibacillus mucilaginosus KNP414]MCG7211286.1 EAL domain-containing protein [Paenibacillus mucilaginosus]WDM30324.1 EAL domain-containing protein [Paenibacillus mucilaginosus]
MSGTYNVYLVLLSYLIAFMSAYSAFDLARRLSAAAARVRRLCLGLAGVILGIGIWAMHFVAILAYETSLSIHYDSLLMLLSVGFAVAASWAGLACASRPAPGLRRLLASGCIVFAGVVGMHFIGMAAMGMGGDRYHWLLLMLGAAIGLAGSFGALFVSFRSQPAGGRNSYLRRLLGAAMMGGAIAGLHYLSMEAMTFGSVGHLHQRFRHAGHQDEMLGIILANCIIFLLSIIVIRGYFLDRRYREGEAFRLAVLESALDGILLVDHQGGIMECNPVMGGMFGYPREELATLHLTDLLEVPAGGSGDGGLSTEAEGREGPSGFALPVEAIRGLLDSRVETTGWRADGTAFPVEISLTRTEGFGRPVFTVFVRDITDRRKAEEHIRQMALRDPLTGLYNRSYLQEKLSSALSRAEGSRGTIGVMFLDLDGFKSINDTFGHDSGDMLLQEVGERLLHCVREEDLVSRQGGDEFIVMLSGVTPGTASSIAVRMIEALARPFYYAGREMTVTPSIGIALYPSAGTSAHVLVKHADAAMYQAKLNGKNHFQFYTAEMEASLSQQTKLEARLKLALQQDEFRLHYAPVMSVQTGRLLGVEALLRWDRDGALIPAGQFIAGAEATGLLPGIGRWVLREACRQHWSWRNAGHPAVTMSVNISARELAEEDFVEGVGHALKETEMQAEWLQLEITEEIGRGRATRLCDRLKELKALGVRLSLDDFGAGAASLRFLQLAPVDELKLDGRLIAALGECPARQAMLEALISLAHGRGMQVIAEGVERSGQLEKLRELACDGAQGYWFGQPMAAGEFERLLSYERFHRKDSSQIS